VAPALIERAAPRPALAEWEALATCPKELMVGGAWRPARSGRTLAVEDPATGEILCEVADAGAPDAEDAMAAAAGAQAGWAAAPARDRARVLRRAADALEHERERMAMLITLEMGKPLAESRDEVTFASEYLEWCAEEAVRVRGDLGDAPDGTARLATERRPVGPCLIIAPWNFPLAVPARGAAAALAAGCTAVLRPSSLTPLSSLALAAVLEGAGLPPGALNVVVSASDDATDGLLADPRLRRLTFTGSGAVGRHLAALAARNLVPAGLELGGQAPFVVFADADLDAAVDHAVAAKMRNGGAACTAANAFHVEAPVAAAFAGRLAERLGDLRLGRGTEPGVDLGPMIGARQARGLQELVDDAVAHGAGVALRGGAVEGPGHFVAPAVLTDPAPAARVMREEIFGPIAPVCRFDDEGELLARLNSCAQGLAAYVQTPDLDRALRVAEALEVGMVAINRGRISSVASPFGGVKGSGCGRAGGADPLGEYVATRALTIGRAA
jgi:succinate-semialdehyde dehydrogenase/glutarate-semialdehyde dehydrogenase